MDWFKNLCRDRPHIPISLASLVSFFMFLQNLAVFMSDGFLDSEELHKLLTGANGFETILLMAIMLLVKEKP